MTESRITDPEAVSARDIELILNRDQSPTVQFSRPGYSRALLRDVNRLCVEFGARLEVRFFAHYGEVFDAAALSDLPDVRWLSIDSLERIRNEDYLLHLASLERLSFGVHHFDKPAFLADFAFEHLTQLVLSETAKRNFDLAPLRANPRLTDLFIQGHAKNIDAMAALPQLASLRLSGMPKRLKLSFVNDISRLRSLTLLLGSRRSIDEISHPLLEELRVVRVRGLETLGSLDRFPALRLLDVEDQLQLRSISVAGTRLRELTVSNCKNLEEIIDLESQVGLEHFRTSRTQLDLDAMLTRKWPDSMKVLALYSSSEKWNAAARVILGQRGYAEFR